MWQCPRRHKVNKGEKYKHTRPLNYQNIKNMILKFTCTNPRIVSAEKDVVETFTSQLLITLFPEPTDSYIYYRVSPSLTDIDMYRWCKYGFMFTCDFILLWVSILKCAITVVWVLVIFGTLVSQRFPRILEKTLDIISFMWVHWDTWENSRGHHKMDVVLEDVLVQIPFPKHLFTPRTQYGHIRTGFWRFRIFPVCRLPS